jgi:two-component system response regulator YesN
MNKVMLVDDEEDICEFLMQILKEKLEFDVEAALSGEKALELVENTEFQICVVDLKLSTSVTGLDVIAAIRKKWPKTKVVAMSGYIDIGLRQKAEHLGVTGFFEKPQDIRPDVFEAKIKALIRK